MTRTAFFFFFYEKSVYISDKQNALIINSIIYISYKRRASQKYTFLDDTCDVSTMILLSEDQAALDLVIEKSLIKT